NVASGRKVRGSSTSLRSAQNDNHERFGFDIGLRNRSSRTLTPMKSIYLIVCVLAVSLVSLPAAEPETPAFPGVQKAMTPEQYEAAGLSKLDPAERAKLDEFIKNYVAVSNEKVATTAVDKAIKEKKVSEPEVIQSRIVGPFTGYTGRTVFTLENG